MCVKSIVLSAILVLALTGCGKDPKVASREFADKGKQFAKEGKLNEAALNYKRALQLDPQSGEAYYELALVSSRQGSKDAAFSAMSQASSLLPERDDIKAQLADLLLPSYSSGGDTSVRDRVNSIAQQITARNPNAYESLRLRGLIASKDGKTAEAGEFLEKAHAMKPSEPDVSTALMISYLDTGKEDLAAALAAKTMASNPAYAPLYDTLAIYYFSHKRFADGERVLRQKASNNPGEATFQLQLARYFLDNNRQADANATIEKMLQHADRTPNAYLSAGEFADSAGNVDQAVAYYRKGASGDPAKELTYRKRVVATLTKAKRYDEALQELNSLVAAHPEDVDSRAARGTTLLDTKLTSNLDAAYADLKFAVTKDPGTGIYHYQLGRALAAKQDLNGARQEFYEAIKANPNDVPARSAGAQMALRSGKNDEALTQSEEILKRIPGDRTARLTRALALSGMGRPAEARTELLQLQKEFPTDSEVNLALAGNSITEGRFEDAARYAAKSGQSGDLRPVRVMVESFAAQGKWDEAIAGLERHLQTQPNQSDLWYLLGTTAERAGRKPVAIRAYERLSVLNPGNAEAQIALGSLYFHSGQTQSALGALQRARSLNGKNPTVYSLLGQIQQSIGNYAAAEAEYRRSLDIAPQSPGVMNNLSYLLADTGRNLDEALTLAQSAVKAAPGNQDLLDTLGFVYLKRSSTDTALQIFSGLAKQSPSNALYHYHYALALQKKGDLLSAKGELQTALKLNPPSQEASNIREMLAKM